MTAETAAADATAHRGRRRRCSCLRCLRPSPSLLIRSASAVLLLQALVNVFVTERLPGSFDVGWLAGGAGRQQRVDRTTEDDAVDHVPFAAVRLRRMQDALVSLDGGDREAALRDRPMSVSVAARKLEERAEKLLAERTGGGTRPYRLKSCFNYRNAGGGGGISGAVFVDMDGSCWPPGVSEQRGLGSAGHGIIVVLNPLGTERAWCGRMVPAGGVAEYRRDDLTSCTDEWAGAAYFPPPSLYGAGVTKSIEVEYSSWGERRERNCDVPCTFFGQVSDIGIVGSFTVRGTNWLMMYSMEGAHYYRSLRIKERDYLRNQYYVTTSFKSEIPVPYFSWSEYKIKSPSVRYDDAIKGASFIASNCESKSGREKWVLGLLKHFRVDSLGNCLHNANPPNGLEIRNKKEIMRQYLFHLAFENGNEEDYITEKLWGALESGTVPVYLGAPNVKDHAPPGSIINVLDFPSPRALANHLSAVANDRQKYEQYQEWRKHEYPDVFVRKYNFTHIHSECRICQWAYAKKYGMPWDHESQRIVEPSLPRSVCVDGRTGLLHNPFKEEWTNGNDSGRNVRGEKRSARKCDKMERNKVISSESYSIHRTVAEHDNVVDMTIKVENKGMRDTTPLYLRLSLGSHLQNNAFVTSHGYGKSINERALWTGNPELCKSGGQFISVQDSALRFTVLSDWPTQMFSPAPSVVQILVYGGATQAAPKEVSWKRLRIILEDRDKLHNGMDDNMPTTFCKFAAKDFLNPLEFFYYGGK